MPQFRLRALSPGRKCVGRNPDGSKRFVNFTLEYCLDQFRQNSALLAAGIPVPVSWEHRDDQKPGRLSRDDWASARAKGTAGWVDQYQQLPDGAFDALITVPDDSDGKQAEVVRFCSPEIDRFTDQTGKDWGEVITHLALTPRPIQHDQPPIARLSVLSAGPVRLAVDPKKGTDMADEKDDDTKDVKRKAEDAQDGDKKDDSEEKDAPTEFGALVEALVAKGFIVPEEVKDMAGLIIAIKASPDDGGGDGLDDLDDPNAVQQVSRQSPIAMSHTKDGEDEDEKEDDDEDDTVDLPANRAGGKGRTRMSTDTVSPALKKQQEQAAGLARKGLTGRIDALVKTGRIPPVVADGLKKEAGKVRLSFSGDGDLEPNAVLTKVEAYEALPKGQSFTTRNGRGRKTRLSHAREVEQPGHVTDDNDAPDESVKAREERQKAFEQTTGRRG
jgi:hypothetical protein